MKMKACFKCGGVFPLDNFYKHPQMADGHLNKCKSCSRADVRRNRREMSDKYNEYDRIRGNRQDKHYQKKYRTKNAEKEKAHAAVRRAMRTGRLKKQPCEVCGVEHDRIAAHHECYNKPLDVVWLCPHHHRWIHG